MALTRRKFLQISVSTGAMVIGGQLGMPALKAFARSTSGAGASVGRWVSTTCQGCTTWCAAQVYVINGRAVKVRGNPHSKASGGNVCPRAHLSLQQVYDPDRVKVPMKRTNPAKGRKEDPRFVPISWDEAMDTIADRMMELRANGEAHKSIIFRGRYTFLHGNLDSALPRIFGTPNVLAHSSICAEAEKVASFYTEGFWGYRDYDLAQTRYVLCWGADPVASNRMVPHAINMWGKLRDQATIAVIDPRLSATAAKAHEWLPVIPGEDSALAVAMAHVILASGKWDRTFVGDFTDGVNRFKVGQEVPEESFAEKHTHGVVKWWNLELKDRTPEWAETHCGIPAAQIRRVALGFADAAPRAISWVSPGATMQVRGAYAAIAGHALNGLVGSVDNVGGILREMSVPTLGGPNPSAYQDEIAKKHFAFKKIDSRGNLDMPAMGAGRPGTVGILNSVPEGIINEDPYDIKLAIGYWNNFVFSCSGTARWEEAMSKLPFFVHITPNSSEMTHFADIVLPAGHHMYEIWGFTKTKSNRFSQANLNVPSIKPIWDVRMDETEIPWMLAEKLAKRGFDNLLRFYRESFPDPETGKLPQNAQEFALAAIRFQTQPLWHSKHPDYGKAEKIKGWEEMLEKGVCNSVEHPYRTRWDNFGTKTKKFEFYSETLKDSLHQHAANHNVSVDEVLKATNYVARGELAFVPHFEPAFRRGDPKEYPFIFFEHRSRLNREGRSQNCTWYQAHKNCDPGDENWDDVVKINPADGRRLGVSNGDLVRLVSPTGAIECHVKLWEGVRPGTVGKCYGQGHWAYGRVAARDFERRIPRGGNNNDILPPESEAISGSTARHGGVTRIRIETIRTPFIS
jgi:anaerobic selenocysteine-containing dehydrogenase